MKMVYGFLYFVLDQVSARLNDPESLLDFVGQLDLLRCGE